MYLEGLARTIAVKGITLMTFTPLKGYTEIVNLYIKDPEPKLSNRHLTSMTIYDALHLTDEERESEIARWPKHERRARIYGEPALGEGMIFPYDEDDVKIAPFEIPAHWKVLGAIDFGGTSQQAHPTAAVKIAHDSENDVVYVVRCYRKKSMKPPEHWLPLRFWGDHLKWAWPRDGIHEEKSTGEQIVNAYRDEGMKTLPVYAQYPSTRRKKMGGRAGVGQTLSILSVERGLLDIGTRIESERFKVFSTCPEWFEEMRTFHRAEGKIVKENDDLMDATRYAIMMLRFADTPEPRRFSNTGEIDWQIGM